MAIIVSIIVHFEGVSDCIKLLTSMMTMVHPSHRIIVVDNYSSPGSFEQLQTAIKAFDVDLIQNHRNAGFGGGINFGWAYAKTKYAPQFLHVINPDAIVLNPSYLNDLTCALNARPDIGMIGPAVLASISGMEVQNTIMPFVSVGSTLRFRLSYSNCSNITNPPKLTEVKVLNGVCFVTTAQAMEEVNGFDEHFFMYVEEHDYCFRLSQKGYKCLFWSGKSVLHYAHGVKPVFDWRQAMIRSNQILFLRKYRKQTQAIMLAIIFTLSFTLQYVSKRKPVTIIPTKYLQTIWKLALGPWRKVVPIRIEAFLPANP